MTAAAVILIALVVLLAYLLREERRANANALEALIDNYDEERERLLREFRDERTELMNRVQHPQVFQPRPSDVRPELHPVRDEPSDLQELARVGGMILGESPE